MIKIGIVGGTGYTGVELIRLLLGHPQAVIEVITSRSEQGQALESLFPNLRGATDLVFSDIDLSALKACDVVFFATPNGVAMGMAPELLAAGARVIDLAADFRIRDRVVWEKWYAMEHSCPELLGEAVYGLCEINRAAIRQARLVANPGCYPTAVQLGLLPLLEQGLVDPGALIADAKSGVSGAGRKGETGLLLCETSETFKAYAVPGHRHLPEIEQGLASAAKSPVGLTFVPHLTPMIRGIHATLYADLLQDDADLQQIYTRRYENEPFVDVMPAGSHPETRSTRGTNLTRIALHRPGGGRKVVILSVIDNLIKGAAGQAVQNMNLMMGLDETTGLTGLSILP